MQCLKVTSISAIVPSTVHRIAVEGRLHWRSGEGKTYPQGKVVLADQTGSVTVKTNNMLPFQKLKVDDCVHLSGLSVHHGWQEDLVELHFDTKVVVPGKRRKSIGPECLARKGDMRYRFLRGATVAGVR